MEKNNTMNISPQLERACGIDIHKDRVSVCFYIASSTEEVKDYPTYTCDLEQIRDDLLAHNIRDVIMESTGVYWIALCSILTAGSINVRVVNPRFVKNMPKEKTDKKDAKWLCKNLIRPLGTFSTWRREMEIIFSSTILCEIVLLLARISGPFATYAACA